MVTQPFDDKSPSLVMRDAAAGGRKALEILRDHYARQRKPRRKGRPVKAVLRALLIPSYPQDILL